MPTVKEEQDTKYEAGDLSISTGTTDYNAKTTGGLFSTVTTAKYLWINSTYAISIKLNSTANNSRSLTAGKDYYFTRNITNFYITNASGSTATVSYWMDN